MKHSSRHYFVFLGCLLLLLFLELGLIKQIAFAATFVYFMGPLMICHLLQQGDAGSMQDYYLSLLHAGRIFVFLMQKSLRGVLIYSILSESYLLFCSQGKSSDWKGGAVRFLALGMPSVVPISVVTNLYGCLPVSKNGCCPLWGVAVNKGL